jgi:uncharacterized membrane protein
MEKRAIGIILTFLGIIGLILSAWYFINHSGSVRDMKIIGVFGVLGIIFFAAGIGLVRNIKDTLKNDERVS